MRMASSHWLLSVSSWHSSTAPKPPSEKPTNVQVMPRLIWGPAVRGPICLESHPCAQFGNMSGGAASTGNNIYEYFKRFLFLFVLKGLLVALQNNLVKMQSFNKSVYLLRLLVCIIIMLQQTFSISNKLIVSPHQVRRSCIILQIYR